MKYSSAVKGMMWKSLQIISPLIVLSIFSSILIGCGGGQSRFHATCMPENSLFLAQTRAFATREEALNIPEIVDSLKVAGIDQDMIYDGSIADGRIYCCGGPNEDDTAIWFYIPQDSQVEIGDIVELRAGKELCKDDTIRAAIPNKLSRIVASKDQVGEECRWLPDNPKLWARVLYCDWMQEEGWTQQEGLYDIWVKK